MKTDSDLAWAYLVELRKEIVASQRVRAQIVGFKITFVSAAVGLIVANPGSVPIVLVAIPAVAAILFDLLIYSYSFSIKRLGYFVRSSLEPKLRDCIQWPADEPLWEEFMLLTWARQRFSFLGNVGLTALVVVPAGYLLASELPRFPGIVLSFLLLVTFVYDVGVCVRTPRQFKTLNPPERFK